MTRNTPVKPTHTTPSLRMKSKGWALECGRFGLVGDTAIAAHLGLAMPTYYRVRTLSAEPGPKFIACALIAFPGARFEDLFETVFSEESAA